MNPSVYSALPCYTTGRLKSWGDQERARAWFKEPKKALGMKTPLQYADTEPGAREVENLLGRLEYGVFS